MEDMMGDEVSINLLFSDNKDAKIALKQIGSRIKELLKKLKESDFDIEEEDSFIMFDKMDENTSIDISVNNNIVDVLYSDKLYFRKEHYEIDLPVFVGLLMKEDGIEYWDNIKSNIIEVNAITKKIKELMK